MITAWTAATLLTGSVGRVLDNVEAALTMVAGSFVAAKWASFELGPLSLPAEGGSVEDSEAVAAEICVTGSAMAAPPSAASASANWEAPRP